MTGAITALASFNGSDGANPDSSVVMNSSGNLYGTAAGGGPYGEGTVYELAKGSGAITALASFYGTGAGPYAGVIMDKSGNLYGSERWTEARPMMARFLRSPRRPPRSRRWLRSTAAPVRTRMTR